MYSKETVQEAIERLASIARDIAIRRDGRRVFREGYAQKRQWHVRRGKGWGIDAKRRSFKTWYDAQIGAAYCVYVFWAGKRCLYVGRTGSGGQRPQAHFEKYWFAQQATRVDLYIVKGPRGLPRTECLAIDMFQPNYNKVRSARAKYTKKCPVCERERRVRGELRALFPLRRGRKRK